MRAAALALSLSVLPAAVPFTFGQAPVPSLESATAETPVEIPRELAALRARYAENILSADRSVTGQWAVTLESLEKARAAAEDYAGAERVRHRREEAIAVAGTDDGRISFRLSVRDITSKGSGLKAEDAAGAVSILNSGAFIDWQITGDFSGWYEVRLTHAVPGRTDRTGTITPFSSPAGVAPPPRKTDADGQAAQNGGLVAFQNITQLSRDTTVLRREIVSTGGHSEWVTVSLGRVEITGNLAKFKLTAEEAARNGLMRFRGLELVPVPPPPPASSGEARLAKAREQFNKDFRGQTQAANNHYRETLTLLEQQARRGNDTDTVVRVREEKNTLASNPEQLAMGDPAGASRTATVVLEAGTSFRSFFRGEVMFDPVHKWFTKLRPANTGSISWRLPAYNVPSGKYSVQIKGRVPLNGGGQATLGAFATGGTAAGPPVKVEVKPVVSPENRGKKTGPNGEVFAPEARLLEVGTVIIGKGAETLTLTVTGLTHADGWLMDLTKVTLTRTGDLPPPTAKNS